MTKLLHYKEDNIDSPAALPIGAQHARREKDPSVPCSYNSKYCVLISYTALPPSAKCCCGVRCWVNARLKSGL
jgi:hypothetical protein